MALETFVDSEKRVKSTDYRHLSIGEYSASSECRQVSIPLDVLVLRERPCLPRPAVPLPHRETPKAMTRHKLDGGNISQQQLYHHNHLDANSSLRLLRPLLVRRRIFPRKGRPWQHRHLHRFASLLVVLAPHQSAFSASMLISAS